MGVVLVLDCADPQHLAEFWTRALPYRLTGLAKPYAVLTPTEPELSELVLQEVPEPKTSKNRMHLDIRTDDIEAEAGRLIALGARRISSEPIEEYGFHWFVMADPEGNEFCVCAEPPPS